MTAQFKQSVIDGGKPYWVWAPLIFSLFYFFPLAFNFEYFTAVTLTIALAIYVIFLFLYTKASYACAEHAFYPVLAMVTLASLGTYITPGTQTLFGFAAFFCGFNFPNPKANLGLVGLIIAILLSAITFNFYDIYFLAPAIIISCALFFMGKAERKDRIHKQAQQHSQKQIKHLATIAERERIARDLHDLVGHSLTSIALKAELAEKLIAANKHHKAQTEISQVAHLSRDMLTTVRAAVSGINKKTLTQQIEVLKQQLQQNNFNVECNIQLNHISANLEANLLLVITESVTNILKHSAGNKVNIHCQQQKQVVNLTISDNGKVNSFQLGNGLTGIQQRCHQFNGDLDIQCKHGFYLHATFKEQEPND